MAEIGVTNGRDSIIPACFEGSEARTSVRTERTIEFTLFRDLGNHSFTAFEKTFIYSEIRGQSSLLATTSSTSNNVVRTTYGISNRYRTARRTIRGWLQKYDSGEILYDDDGRPSDINGEQLARWTVSGKSTRARIRMG